jgi:hypothetical protein
MWTCVRLLLTSEDMKRIDIELFTPEKPRPERIDFRVTADTKQKYSEMRRAGAKIAPKIAEAIDEIIEKYYETFKELGA